MNYDYDYDWKDDLYDFLDINLTKTNWIASFSMNGYFSETNFI